MPRNALLSMGIAMLALYASNVFAQTQFDVTGKIEAGTCEWVVGDDNRTIELSPIDASVLNLNGSGNFQTFDLSLQKCAPGVNSATFVFSGTPDANDPLRFANTGSGKGAGIELETQDGVTIGANGTRNSRVIPIVGDGAVIKLQAGYWRTGAVAAGSVLSVAMVTVTYE